MDAFVPGYIENLLYLSLANAQERRGYGLGIVEGSSDDDSEVNSVSSDEEHGSDIKNVSLETPDGVLPLMTAVITRKVWLIPVGPVK